MKAFHFNGVHLLYLVAHLALATAYPLAASGGIITQHARAETWGTTGHELVTGETAALSSLNGQSQSPAQGVQSWAAFAAVAPQSEGLLTASSVANGTLAAPSIPVARATSAASWEDVLLLQTQGEMPATIGLVFGVEGMFRLTSLNSQAFFRRLSASVSVSIAGADGVVYDSATARVFDQVTNQVQVDRRTETLGWDTFTLEPLAGNANAYSFRGEVTFEVPLSQILGVGQGHFTVGLRTESEANVGLAIAQFAQGLSFVGVRPSEGSPLDLSTAEIGFDSGVLEYVPPVASVPEPSTLALAGLAVATGAFARGIGVARSRFASRKGPRRS